MKDKSKGREIAAFRNRARPWGKTGKQTRSAAKRAAIKEGALPVGYPPGVSGNEYQIAGAEREWDETRWCTICETDRTFGMEAYQNDVWGTCEHCGCVQDFDDAGDEDPNAYDAWKDRQIDEG